MYEWVHITVFLGAITYPCLNGMLVKLISILNQARYVPIYISASEHNTTGPEKNNWYWAEYISKHISLQESLRAYGFDEIPLRFDTDGPLKVSIGSWNMLATHKHQAITWNNGNPIYWRICVSPGLWWRHQIETFSTLLAFCDGKHRSLVDSPHKGQWRGALTFLSAPEQTVEQTIDTPMFWDTVALISYLWAYK